MKIQVLIAATMLASLPALSPAQAPLRADAQMRPSVSLAVGRISTTKSCTYFQNSAGSAAMVASPWVVAAAASWRTWWVKDCVTNFATMRSTLGSALAAAPGARVGAKARYSVSLNVLDVGDESTSTGEQGRFGAVNSALTVSFDLSVRDGSGRSVYGTVLTKKVEIGSGMAADGFRTGSASSGNASYGRLQNEIALAAARSVAFHFTPIEVISGQGREVQINYGGPYLKLGDLILLSTPDRSATVRYRVTAAASGFSTAQVEPGGDPSRIGPGSVGTYVEAEDPMQNGRRFQRVDLP